MKNMKKISMIFYLILIFLIYNTAYAFDDIEEMMKDEKEIYEEKLSKENKSNFNIVEALVDDVNGKVFIKYDDNDMWIRIVSLMEIFYFALRPQKS